jgi:hypothetical protein
METLEETTITKGVDSWGSSRSLSPSLMALKVLSGMTYMINAPVPFPSFRASAVRCVQQGADRSPDEKNIFPFRVRPRDKGLAN